MANNSTALTAIDFKGTYVGKVTPVTLSLDQNADRTLLAAPTDGKQHAILGGFIRNTHASDAVTVSIKSGSNVLMQIPLAAGAVYEFASDKRIINEPPAVICLPNEALAILAPAATVIGTLFTGTAPVFGRPLS